MANVLSYKKKKEGKVILLECMKICSPIFFLSHYNSHIKRKNKPQNISEVLKAVQSLKRPDSQLHELRESITILNKYYTDIQI